MHFHVNFRIGDRNILLRITKILLLLGLSLCLPAMTSRSISYTPRPYNTVGQYSEDSCPILNKKFSFVIGFQSRSGAWIDQIGIICAVIHPDGSFGEQWRSPLRGGMGGSAQEVTCRPGYFISRVDMAATNNNTVKVARFTCQQLNGGASFLLDVGPNIAPTTINLICPDQGAMAGINTRSGQYVNGLGLRCDSLVEFDAAGTPYDASGKPLFPTNAPTSADGCAGLAGDELAICKQHNQDRAQHGVPPLTWSADLARNAQAWVNGCHTDTDKQSGNTFFCHQQASGCGTDPNYHFGENLSWAFPSNSGQQAVDGWYCEGDNFDYNNPVFVGGTLHNCQDNPSGVNGHFTQIVWKSTTKLGCAKNTCSLGGNAGTLWACEYDPPGNITGQYKENVPPPVNQSTRSAHTDVHQWPTTILSDVDLYDTPGGTGKVIGMLRQGQMLALFRCRADNWCQVAGGWAWGSFLLRAGSR